MEKKKKITKCYNAGKISGLPYLEAFQKFARTDRIIRENLGYEPVNPMVQGIKADNPWWMHMVYDLWLMARCQAVYFQPDWTQSRGATIEMKVARFLRKEITEGV